MGTWRKWAGFGVWCVVLFGGMILAGTGLWPLGAAAAAVGAVGLLLWGRRHEKVAVCPSCGAALRRTDFSLAPAASGTRTSKECAAVRRYIDSHFKESLSLDVLAEVAHVNKYYLVHTFSKEYGISPINYLISRRIAESKQLLSDTDHSLSQISHMLGFSSPSYFSQSFRKLEGVSPMEYRRQSKM